MRRIGLVLLGAVVAPSAARAGGTPAAVRAYMAEYTTSRLEKAHAMIPAWARRYNKNCNDCHWPAVPRLNAYGMRFKWAGYRPPDELGEQVNVAKVENYLAVRGRMRYQYNKTQNQPASNSQFAFEDYTIFYGGPFGKNYGAFFELERAPDELELVANVASAWGKEKAFGGFRIGQFHWLQREGLAGFDRPIGINTPSPLGGKITASVPFSFNNDQVGVALVGLDTAVAPSLTSHFWRLGLTANKIVDRFEAMGMILYGKDFDLPAGAPENKGVGYWFQGAYMFSKSSFTLFGRYEYLDPNTDVANNANHRYVLGGVVPLGLPEYLRLALEGTLDSPQASGAPKKYGVSAQVMLNF